MRVTWNETPHGRYAFLEGAPGTAPDGRARELIAVRCQWCKKSLLGRSRVQVLVKRHGTTRAVVTAALELLAHQAVCRDPSARLPEPLPISYGSRSFEMGRRARRRSRPIRHAAKK